jgi:hypothetical protein
MAMRVMSSAWQPMLEARRAYVARQLRDAYDSATAATAKKKLMQLASWLDSNGHTDAATSLREGLDETLTVMRLGLTGTLRRTFATTNPIENMNGSLRRVARNVKRWKDEAMIRRWVALGIAEAQKGFRRVKGHIHMPLPRGCSSPRHCDRGVREEGRVRIDKNLNEPSPLPELQQGAGRSLELRVAPSGSPSSVAAAVNVAVVDGGSIVRLGPVVTTGGWFTMVAVTETSETTVP